MTKYFFSKFALILIQAVIVIDLIYTSPIATANDDLPKSISGIVERIIDGDTVHLTTEQTNLNPIKIRMLNIDAPESHFADLNQNLQSQPYGSEAGEALEKMIPAHTQVSVQHQGLDMYHRLLGVIFLDNKNINLQMVKEGYAIPYILCPKNQCSKMYLTKQKTLSYIRACHFAQKNHSGIWNTKNPLNEMPFEFRLRLKGRKSSQYAGNYLNKKLYPPTEYKKVDVCSRVFFHSKEDAIEAGFTQ